MTKAYAVMWLEEEEGGGHWITNTLVYRGAKSSSVRTYYEGHLDERAGEEDKLPRFDNIRDAMLFLTMHIGQKALVEVSVAKLMRPDTYADPV